MMLVGIGIAMSVPIVIVGSGVLATLMNRYPAIIWVGGGVLGFVAGEMLLDDPLVLRALGEGLDANLKLPVAIAMASALTAIGWRLSQKRT
jgi:predicted tellurium resistance membrane protein TerC